MAQKSAVGLVTRRAKEFLENADYASAVTFFNQKIAGRRSNEESDALANEYKYTCLDYFLYSQDSSLLDYLGQMQGFPDNVWSDIYNAVLSHCSGKKELGERKLKDIADSFKDNTPVRTSSLAWLLFLNSNGIAVPAASEGGLENGKSKHYQFWDTGNPPEDVAGLMRQWKDILPEDEYCAFDDGAAQEFIRDELGSDFAKWYDTCWHPAMKADMFRLCALYVRGGTYSDADLEVKQDFPHLKGALTQRPSFLFRTNKSLVKITNSFMGSPPASDIFATCLVELTNRLDASDKSKSGRKNSIAYISGPGLVTDILIETLSQENAPAINAISTGFLVRHICSQHNVSYKGDERSWQRWQESNKQPA